MSDAEPLFVAEGRPSELDILTLEDELGPGAVKGAHGELDLPFREPSYFSIGDPVVWPVSDLADPELQLQAHAYEFHQVQLTCSFQAASGRLSEARFTVDLTARGPAGAGLPAEDAIAYDMFPALLESMAPSSRERHSASRDVVLLLLLDRECLAAFGSGSASVSAAIAELPIQAFSIAIHDAPASPAGERPPWRPLSGS